MAFLTTGSVRTVVLLAALAGLTACGLPRSGPNKRELFSGSVMEHGDSFVVALTDRVTSATALNPEFGFTKAFLNAGVVGSDTINPGDVLSLTIWENVDDGLLANAGANATVLSEVQVDGNGYVFVPYAGRVKAAGNTPEAIRRLITSKLDAQTPDPQVMVARASGNGATVTMSGKISSQGVYPIERPTRRLTAMIAAAGGVAVEPEVAQVKIMRGGQVGRIWFNDLFSNPTYDIPLRDGDRILVEADPRSFTILGAAGSQSVIEFETRNLSALEALAQVGGLKSSEADPTGVFVLRNETETIARRVLGRDDLNGSQRMIYALDLTQPNGLFLARDFLIRDGDTLYVTEAPFVQWQKTIGAVTGAANSATTLSNLATSD